MGYLQQFIDLRRSESDPKLFAIVLTLLYTRALIQQESDRRRPDDDLALHPHHLEAFLARAVERTRKDKCMAQEWHRLQLFLPGLKEAWERGKTLFQADLDQAKDKQYMDYFSMIDFAVDGYAYLSSSRIYPDNLALRGWRSMCIC